MMRKDKLEACKEFPAQSTADLEEYLKKTEVTTFNNMWTEITNDKDTVEDELLNNPPTLTGVKRAKVCSGCNTELPQTGKGSRKCAFCRMPWKTGEVKKTSKPEHGRKEERNLTRGLELF
jgi:hypothetical protein